MTKEAKIKAFDPNGPALQDANVFGLPFTCDEADIVLVPVPWEVTTSYGGGTAQGPAAILEASRQVDLHHPEFPDLWKAGVAMEEIPEELVDRSDELKDEAAFVIDFLETGGDEGREAEVQRIRKHIDQASEELNDHVEERVGARLDQGKRVGLVGGDHSTPLGFFRAQAKRHDQFGILHLDAHLDLRKAYEGFTHSHASILYNALALPQVAKVVSVGIRDFCLEEQQVVDREQGRVQVFHDAELQAQRFAGDTWQAQCDRIIAALPDKVHVTFDIDGLDPTLCPNTGTPVPGGLSFPQATYLLSRLADSGRKVIGFDLVEVSPGEDEWDGNVGARLLWHLCGVLWKAG